MAVTFDAGLVSISCQNAPLSAVFDLLEEVTGIELILEDAVKSTKLSADLTDVPLAMALQRLLEGNGVNYAVMMDPRDWGRVDKVYVGAGGGAPARRAAPPPRRAPQPRPQPVEEDYDDYDDELDEFEDDVEEMDDEEMGTTKTRSRRRVALPYRAICRHSRTFHGAALRPAPRRRSSNLCNHLARTHRRPRLSRSWTRSDAPSPSRRTSNSGRISNRTSNSSPRSTAIARASARLLSCSRGEAAKQIDG